MSKYKKDPTNFKNFLKSLKYLAVLNIYLIKYMRHKHL